MKKYFLSRLVLIALILGLGIQLNAQDESTEGYQFTVVKEHDATAVKNQYRSGTCWSFSGISFLESELLRTGKGEYDLSEMFIVRYTYLEKAIKYVRLHGNLNFAGGGQFHDVINMIKKYGIVPESAYSGKVIGERHHIHSEMDAAFKAYMESIIENKNRKLSPAWIKGFEGLLDAYLGEVPETFTYNGKEYTPKSFAESLDLNWDDYINLTSYAHHPYYTTFGIEIPDNWAWGHVYNLPLDEMMEAFDYIIDAGYTIAWATDVSETGFSWTNGIAVVPLKDKEDLTDLEQAKWSKMSGSEKKAFYNYDGPGEEKEITVEMRQQAFDNYKTTDDHGMHITGIVKDQEGNMYYKVKNSWGTAGHLYDGYLYASKAFTKYKTMSVMVNKNSLPKPILKKLGLK